jgi:hypothetical protein
MVLVEYLGAQGKPKHDKKPEVKKISCQTFFKYK